MAYGQLLVGNFAFMVAGNEFLKGLGGLMLEYDDLNTELADLTEAKQELKNQPPVNNPSGISGGVGTFSFSRSGGSPALSATSEKERIDKRLTYINQRLPKLKAQIRSLQSRQTYVAGLEKSTSEGLGNAIRRMTSPLGSQNA